jgi:hypothetical protein
MSKLARIILFCCLATLALDTLGSWLASLLVFPYVYLSPLSFLIYALAGYLTARLHSTQAGVMAGAVVGLVDGTIGWAISWIIGPGDISGFQPSFDVVIGATLIAVAIGAIGGLVGGVVGSRARKRALDGTGNVK